MHADSVVQDIRYAVRTLRRAPLFAATVAVTMGLGLGLLGSAFTLVNAYLLRPIDLPNPHALYALSWDTEARQRHQFSLPDYEALPPEAFRLASFAAGQSVTVMQGDVSMGGMLVTGNYFELLGTRPALGRLLRPGDGATRGAGAVAVLSHHAWRSRYGSDPAIVGRKIDLGRQRFEVVGVTQPGESLTGHELVSFFAPLTMANAFPATDFLSDRNNGRLAVVARLHDGVAAGSLRAWFEVWLRQRYLPESDAAPVAARVDSLATRLTLDGVTLTLSAFILSAFGLVLLVASANVTNLMLARALARQPEIAVRLALGASRWRVARQLVVESLVLAVPAAAAGLALVVVTARVFPALILATWPISTLPVDTLLVPLDPDWRVVGFLAVAAVVSSVIITLAPAGRLAGLRLAQVSRGEGTSDAHGSRLRSGLVALQIGACALFLVAATGLLDESSRLANPDVNLDYERVSLVRIDPQVRSAVAARLGADPAVARVAVTWKPPLTGPLPTTRVIASETSVALNAGYTAVSPGYFDMFGIRIVRGRAFTPAESEAESPVAIVSAATAATLWPGLDPIGRTVHFAAERDARASRSLPRGGARVIGVTEDVVTGALIDGIDTSCIYLPTHVRTPAEVSLLVRAGSDDRRALRAALVRAVNDVAPATPFQQFPMVMVVGGVSWVFAAFSTAASLLGAVGLLFAFSGTHAVVSFLVAQRRREFGVRMALGASASQIVWGMVKETSRVAAAGLVAGLAVIAGLVRLASGAVAIVPDFGVRPFVLGTAIVVLATAVAVLAPLRSAARTDPARALRAM